MRNWAGECEHLVCCDAGCSDELFCGSLQARSTKISVIFSNDFWDLWLSVVRHLAACAHELDRYYVHFVIVVYSVFILSGLYALMSAVIDVSPRQTA